MSGDGINWTAVGVAAVFVLASTVVGIVLATSRPSQVVDAPGWPLILLVPLVLVSAIAGWILNGRLGDGSSADPA